MITIALKVLVGVLDEKQPKPIKDGKGGTVTILENIHCNMYETTDLHKLSCFCSLQL